MADDTFNRQVADVETTGRKAYGEKEWDAAIKRLGQVSQTYGGFPEPVMRQMISNPDAASNLFHAGRNARLAMLQAAQDPHTGNPELAQQLDAEERALRAEERKKFNERKGRVF
jgi:hypothetical protein